MYICHSTQDSKALRQIHTGQTQRQRGGGGGRLGCLVYRSLCAVLHVIDGQLDLSLLSDHGVLKEGHAAQVDGVTGALRTQRVGVGVGVGGC